MPEKRCLSSAESLLRLREQRSDSIAAASNRVSRLQRGFRGAETGRCCDGWSTLANSSDNLVGGLET